ncbi:hypothetical protein IWQ57_006311, partial [Coemansia nantahalensis]
HRRLAVCAAQCAGGAASQHHGGAVCRADGPVCRVGGPILRVCGPVWRAASAGQARRAPDLQRRPAAVSAIDGGRRRGASRRGTPGHARQPLGRPARAVGPGACGRVERPGRAAAGPRPRTPAGRIGPAGVAQPGHVRHAAAVGRGCAAAARVWTARCSRSRPPGQPRRRGSAERDAVARAPGRPPAPRRAAVDGHGGARPGGRDGLYGPGHHADGAAERHCGRRGASGDGPAPGHFVAGDGSAQQQRERRRPVALPQPFFGRRRRRSTCAAAAAATPPPAAAAAARHRPAGRAAAARKAGRRRPAHRRRQGDARRHRAAPGRGAPRGQRPAGPAQHRHWPQPVRAVGAGGNRLGHRRARGAARDQRRRPWLLGCGRRV